jgi:hypothetical protein
MGISLEKALLDPAAVFPEPEKVLDEEDLTREEKIAILQRWEFDARELSVAEEENMAGGPPNRLGAILRTLRQLDTGNKLNKSAPTKQGG